MFIWTISGTINDVIHMSSNIKSICSRRISYIRSNAEWISIDPVYDRCIRPRCSSPAMSCCCWYILVSLYSTSLPLLYCDGPCWAVVWTNWGRECTIFLGSHSHQLFVKSAFFFWTRKEISMVWISSSYRTGECKKDECQRHWFLIYLN